MLLAMCSIFLDGFHLSRYAWVNDTNLGDKRVGESGLAVVDVGDHGHVPDVLLFVHAFSHLVGCEVDLEMQCINL